MLNIISFLSLFVLLLVPTAYCIIQTVKNKTELSKSVYLCLFALASSIAMVFFSQENSSEAQIELLGSSFGVMSIFLVSLVDAKKAKFYSPLIIFSGICFGITTMFKEPFALVCGVCLLLFCKDLKELLYRVVLPVAYAVVTALLILLLSNCFVPYFTIYIKNMFSSHITIFGSPFERMLKINKIFSYSFSFAWVLPIIYIVCMFFTALSEVQAKYADNLVIDILFRCIGFAKPILFLYVASFAVGLGGQYYNHHYVFAVPYFITLLLVTCRYLSRQNLPFFTKIYTQEKYAKVAANVVCNEMRGGINCEKIRLRILKSMVIYPLVTLFVLLSVASFKQIPPKIMNNFEYVQNQTQITKVKASYIDELLDSLGEENYLWIGFNGYVPFANTKHLPLGPSFAQHIYNFGQEDTFYAQAFIRQLESANVVVIQRWGYNLGALNERTWAYIEENFTDEAPLKVQALDSQKPNGFEWLIYYRVSAFEFE